MNRFRYCCPSLLAVFLLITIAISQEIQTGEQIWVPMKVSSFLGGKKDLKLEATLYKPEGNGPFPLLIMNHGSTGPGKIPARQTLRFESFGKLFTQWGFVMLAPMRRGRGQSDGDYEEPYWCSDAEVDRGIKNAIQDLDAVFNYVKTLPYIDPSRILLSGVSRGGILSVVYAAERPASVRAVINFVGGWMGEGCTKYMDDPNLRYFKRSGARTTTPMLFLYAGNDSYYSKEAIKSYVRAFERAGGKVVFRLYESVGEDGHYLSRYPDIWLRDVEDFLKSVHMLPIENKPKIERSTLPEQK